MIEEPLLRIKPVFVPIVWYMRFLPYHIGISLFLAAIMIAGYVEMRSTVLMRHRMDLLPLYITWLCMITLTPMVFLKIREYLFFISSVEVYEQKILFKYRKNRHIEIPLNSETTVTLSVSRLQQRYGCGTLLLAHAHERAVRVYDIIRAEQVKKEIEGCIHG